MGKIFSSKKGMTVPENSRMGGCDQAKERVLGREGAFLNGGERHGKGVSEREVWGKKREKHKEVGGFVTRIWSVGGEFQKSCNVGKKKKANGKRNSKRTCEEGVFCGPKKVVVGANKLRPKNIKGKGGRESKGSLHLPKERKKIEKANFVAAG